MEEGDTDSTKLIQEVKKFRSLWDQKSCDYANSTIKIKEWALVALELDCTVDEVKSRWRVLKDTFIRELKITARSGQASTWTYFVDMSFLLESFNKLLLPKPNNSLTFSDLDISCSSSVSDNIESSKNCLVACSPEDPESFQRKKIKMNTGNSAENLNSRSCRPSSPIRFNTPLPEENNEDYYFLLSLLPSFQQMSTQQKMFLKIKIMQDVYNASYGGSMPNLSSDSSSGVEDCSF